jgi:hypothetical protein
MIKMIEAIAVLHVFAISKFQHHTIYDFNKYRIQISENI